MSAAGNDLERVNALNQQLSDVAERLRLATEGTKLATWDLNLQTREILHSPRLAEIFGFDKSKVLRHTEMRSHIHPDDIHAIVEKAFDVALKLGTYNYEARVVHPDKSIHWIRTQGKVIFDGQQTPLRMLGTMMDITEAKLAEQQLAESEERLNIVIEASGLGTWELDLATDKLTYSKRYLEIFGVSDQGLISHHDFLSRIHPDSLPIRNKAFAEALELGDLYYELPIIWHDGGIHWVEVQGKVFYDATKKPARILGTLRDISELKSYHLKIEESERRFRTVADTAPALIWVASPDKLCNFFNKAWLNFTGRTMVQEIGNGWADGVHPEDLQRCIEIFFDSFDKREQFYMEFRLKRHDGIYRWISDNGVPRFTTEGIFEGYIGACMDIHDRVLFEENLKESESRLRIAALSSELGTWTYIPATNEMTWDSQSRVLFGVNTEVPVTVELFWSKMHPDDRDGALQKMLRALDPDIAETYDAEYRVMDVGGIEERWIHGKGKAFFDENRIPYLFSGTILDITEKRLALKELLEKEARFRLLADSMPQFVWTGDEKGTLNYFNKSVYDYSGLTSEQIAKEGWLQIVHPDEQDENINQWIQSVSSGNNFLFEHRFRRHDGEYRWQLSRAMAQRGTDGKIQMWVGTSTDIHDRKIFTDDLETKVEQRTQELKISNDELRKINNELEQFAYVASHDLQEPLRKIQTFSTRILEMEGDNLSIKGQDYFSRMQAAAKRMQQLILDLLSFSRANTSEKHFEHTDLNLLLEKVKEQLSDLIDRKKVVIRSTILPDMNVIVFQFEQLFSNIIGNAIKFAKTDGPCIIDITSGIVQGDQLRHASADKKCNYNFIRIRDNGIGFDPQFENRIFQVFQRLHGKEDYEGTGIGLAICKRIAQNHHGFIEADSELGKGAAFTVYIPAE